MLFANLGKFLPGKAKFVDRVSVGLPFDISFTEQQRAQHAAIRFDDDFVVPLTNNDRFREFQSNVMNHGDLPEINGATNQSRSPQARPRAQRNSNRPPRLSERQLRLLSLNSVSGYPLTFGRFVEKQSHGYACFGLLASR
jgi:hypothetical protein